MFVRHTLIILFTIQMSGLMAQQYSDSISVNFFLLDECRITQNMTGEINHVFDTYQSDTFHFVGYFPNFSSKPNKIEAFVDHYKLGLPVKTDYYKTKAKRYGASIAPQVVVYDEKFGKLVYRGRIDNSYAAVGSRRRVITSKDLREVLESIRRQEKVAIKETKAIGCFINFNELN